MTWLERYAVALARQEFEPLVMRESRPCPCCEKTAWHVEDGPEGLRAFQCAEGHLLISQVVAVENR